MDPRQIWKSGMMMKKMVGLSLALVALFALLLTPGVAGATPGLWRWYATGLAGETVQTVAIDPTTATILYAGTTTGVYKSTDSGVSWNKFSTGLTTLSVTALVIDPTNPKILYAATWGGGVFKSIDSAGTWGLVTVAGIATDLVQSSTTTLYEGIFTGGVSQTTTSGSSWTPANTGLTAPYGVWALAVDSATTPVTIYLGTRTTGVYKSIDSGASWSSVKSGLTSLDVRSLAVDQTTIPSTTYAGTATGVFKSINGGSSWTLMSNGPATAVTKLAVDRTVPSTLYAGTLAGGIFKSTDAGLTWSGFSTTLTNLNVQALAIARTTTPSTIYAGTGGSGLFVLFQQPVDTTPPTGSMTINSGATLTTNATVTLNLSATDAVGVTGYYLSTVSTPPAAGAAGWTTITESKSYRADVPNSLAGDGAKTLYVWYKDAEGNVSPTASAGIILDTTLPTDGTITATPGTGQVALNWSGFSDTGSGISVYTAVYSIGSAPASCATGTQLYTGTATSFTHSGLVNGTQYYYRVCATDVAGFTSPGVTASAIPDASAPAGSLSFNGGAAATSSPSVTITLTATDAVGVTGYYLSTVSTPPTVGMAGWIPVVPSTTGFSTTLSFSLSGVDGAKAMYVWYRDSVGNVSTTASSSIILDTTIPIDGIVTATSGNGQVALSWSGFTDTGSGIAGYTVVYDTVSTPVSCLAGTQIYSGVLTSFVHTNLSKSSMYYYRVCAYDNVGKLSVGAVASALPDTIVPVGGISINSGASFTSSSSVILALSATDDGGVTGYYISTVASPPAVGVQGWVAVASNPAYSANVSYLLSSGDGAKKVYVWYRDLAGNLSVAASYQILLDTTPPVNGTLAATPGNGQVSLSWSGYSDTGSGLASYAVVYDTVSMPVSCVAGTSLYTGTATTFTHANLSRTTTYYYRACALDNAGNVSSGAVSSSTPDITAPVGGITVNGGAVAAGSSAAILTFTATDDGGVTGYYFSTVATIPAAAAAGWTSVPTTIAFSANLPYTLSSGDGAKTVYAWYKDTVGNVSAVATAQILLDTAPPVDGLLTATPGNGQIALSWNGYSDAGSGITGYTVVYDTAGTPASCAAGTQLYTGASASFTHTNLSKSTRYYYRVCATDSVGNSSAGAVANAMADITVPVGGISLNGGAAATKSAAITVGLSATDDGGVTGYYLSTVATPPVLGAAGWISVGSMTSYSATSSLTLSAGDGVKAVYAWYRDIVGNVSAAATAQILLDTTPPTDGVLTATPGNGQVALTWSSYTDGGSGIAGYTVVYDTAGTPATCTAGTQLYSGATASFIQTNLSKSTRYYYRVCATDSVGNSSAGAVANAMADITAPVGGISLNGGATATKSTTLTVALTATDDGGVTGYYLSAVATPPAAGAVGWVTVGSMTSYSVNVSFALSSGDGVKTVYAWFRDTVGNLSAAVSSQISLDSTPPTDGVLTAAPGNGQISLAWSGFGDAGSGVTGYTVVYDTTTTPTTCATGTPLYTGAASSFMHGNLVKTTRYYYRVCAVDGAGNSSVGAVANAIPDTSAPVGGISLNGGAIATKSATITVTLTATDDGGVTGYYLSTVSTSPAAAAAGWSTVGSLTSYSATLPTFPLNSGDGVKTVYVWYKDAVGNVSATASSQIILDTTPPSDGVLTATPGNGQISLAWSGFVDAGSGVTGYTVVYDTTTTPATCATGTPLYTGAAPSFMHGNLVKTTRYYYRVCAVDGAGNSSAGAGANAMADISAPVGGISLNGGASATKSATITVTLTATDDGGVTGYYLSAVSTPPAAAVAGWITAGSSTSYSASVSFPLSSGDGSKTVYAWYKDAVGNVSSAVTSQIILDTTSPLDGVLTATAGNGLVTLSWSGYSDAGSGVAAYTLVYDTAGPPPSCAAGTQLYTGATTSFIHANLVKTTSYYYRLCAVDVAGNSSVGATVGAIPDNFAPVGGIIINGGAAATSATTVTLALSATDDGGVTGYYLATVATPPAPTAGGWIPFTSATTFSGTASYILSSGDGIKTLYVWYKDAAGNVSATASNHIIFDTTPPVDGIVTATPSDGVVSLSWSGYSDAGSGISGYSVVYDTAAVPASCATGTLIYNGAVTSFTHGGLSKSANYNYRVCATDNVGKISAGAVAGAIPDITAPVGGISINAGATATKSSTVTLTLSATDDGGVAGYYLATVATTPTAIAAGWTVVPTTIAYSANVAYALSSGDGAKKIYAWYKDLAGNVSTVLNYQIILDTTFPTDGVLTATSGDGQVSLSWTGYSDVGSGIASYSVVYGTVALPATCSAGTQVYSGAATSFVHTSLSKSSLYYYRVCAVDGAGNISSGAVAVVTPDITAPVGGISINGGASATKSTAATLALSATDDGGITGYYLSTVATPPTAGAAGWTTVLSSTSYSTTVAYSLSSGDGAKKVYVWYKDGAGNVSVAASSQIILDTNLPTDGVLTAAPGDGQVSLSWTGYIDAGSGIASYSVVYGTVALPATCSAGTQVYSGAATSFVHTSLSKSSPYYYRVCAVDGAGNISTGAVAVVTPDITAPVGGISINGGASATKSSAATLALSATDDGGITGYYLSTVATPPTVGAVGWTTVSSATSYSATVAYALSSGDGAKKVYVWYKDGAGNVSATASSQIILDNSSPADGVLTATTGDGQLALSWSGYSDAGSGIASYSVVYGTLAAPVSCSVGTLAYTGALTTFTHANLSKSTTYYYRVCAVDYAGNVSGGAVVSAIPDIIPPVGGISINAGASATRSAAASLALSATDDGGVTGYYLATVPTPPATGAAGWTAVTATTAYSANISYTLGSGDGVKKIYVWYKDVAGNVSSAIGGQIVLDNIPPTDGLVTVVPGDGQLALSWSGYSDPGSGVAGYTLVYGIGTPPVSCSAGTQLYTGGSTSFIHTSLSKSSTYYYRVCAADNAGNVSSGAVASATPDIIPPVGVVSINTGSAVTKNSEVTLNLSATDDGSVIGYYLSTTSLPPTAGAAGWTSVVPTPSYGASISYVLSSGDGAKQVYVWFKDIAGNVSVAATSQIILDMTPPTDGIVTVTPGDGQIVLGWSGFSDVGSGIATYTVVYNTGSSPSSCATGTQIYTGALTSFTHLSLSKSAIYSYRVCANDNAGNASQGAVAFATPDITAPVGGISISGGVATTKSTTVTLTLSATDDGGIVGYYLSATATPPTAGGAGWVAVTSTIGYNVTVSYTLTGADGVKTLYAWYKDLAGNLSATVTAQILLDTASPADGVLTTTPGDGQVLLSWSGYSDAGSGITGYTLVYSTGTASVSCASGTQIYTGVATSYTHVDLINGSTYFYRLCATDAVGNSSIGTIAVGTPQSAGTVNLTATIDTTSGSGNGTMNSITPGASFTLSSGSLTSPFTVGTALVLRVLPDSSSFFTGWSGDCSGTGDCSLIMDVARSVTATFSASPKVKVGNAVFATLQLAYDDAATTSGAVIKMLGGALGGAFSAVRNISVILDGGYNADYSTVTGDTALQGQVKIVLGTVTVKKLTIR